MGLSSEFERRWLLRRLPDVTFGRRLRIRQGYIEQNRQWVRVRETRFPDESVQYILCRKLPIAGGNLEWEAPVSQDAFDLLWTLCEGNSLEKVRHEFRDGAGWLWEIDVYEGALSGLVLMELELPDPQASFSMPDALSACVIREVTGDFAWSNRALSRCRTLPAL